MDTTAHSAHDLHGHEGHEEHHLGFWQKYIFSTDHKVIGIQYGITALCFLFFGFCLMMLMRWQLAYPNQPIPVFGPLLRAILDPTMMASNGAMTADLYNSFGAMHGTI